MQCLGPELTHRFLMLLRRTSVLQPIIEPVSGVATHSEDDWILSTAKNAHAQFLMTGDKALQADSIVHVFGTNGPRRNS